ncbi:hypothetical protein TURU_008475 [Turdus rufiventris]|nr:hypothetical protein TURU_008475 [Turdus rufiventris]
MNFHKPFTVKVQTATEDELGSAADLLALVQWKPWERETQGKNKTEDIMSGYSEDVTRTLLVQECNRDLITKKIVAKGSEWKILYGT